MNHLDKLENRSVHILREAYANFRNLCMLWSIGKDSTVLLWLARKAFFGHVPFPLVHIDTHYKILESAQSNKNLFISIGGIAASLWPFSRAVKSLMASINEVYNHEKRPPLKQLGISMLLTAAFVIMIIVSIILLLFGRRLGEIIFRYLGSPYTFLRVWDYLRYELSVLILLVFFIIMYKTIPSQKQRICDVFPGASFATLFWLLMSSVFSLFMNRYFKFASIYGGIAGIIFLIVWLYWAMHIILIGAVINAVNSESTYRNLPMKIKK
jgi:membrane protein